MNSSFLFLMATGPHTIPDAWLGGYRIMGETTNGHPAFQNVVDESRCLWYAKHSWLVGPRRALGKRRHAILMVWAGDGRRNHDPIVQPDQVHTLTTKGLWLRLERQPTGPSKWVEAPKLRCLGGAEARAAADKAAAADAAAVAAGSSTVVLLGRGPAGLGHDFLGEYLRREPVVAQKGEEDNSAPPHLVSGRAVFLKRGDARKALWYVAESRTWMAGPKNKLGRARGAISAIDGSFTPENVAANWSVWDPGAGQWVVAPGLRCLPEKAWQAGRDAAREAVAAEAAKGTPTVFVTGFVAHELIDWLGAYVRAPGAGATGNGRAVYTRRDGGGALWHDAVRNEWCVGPRAPAKEYDARAVPLLRVHSEATVPERIPPTAQWRLRTGEAWRQATGVRCLAGRAGRAALQSDRAAVSKALRGGEAQVFFVGTFGKPFDQLIGAYTRRLGRLQAKSSRRAKRVRRGNATTVAVEQAGAAQDDDELPRRLIYHHSEFKLWFAGGEWRAGPTRSGKTLFSSRDLALLPEQINSSWSMVNARRGAHHLHDMRLLSGSEGRAALVAASTKANKAVEAGAATVVLATAQAGRVLRGHEWLGEYARREHGGVIGGRAVFVKRGDSRKALWYVARTGRWVVGAKGRLGKARGAMLSAFDGSLTPEGVATNWSVWDAGTGKWAPAPGGVRCLAGEEGRAALAAANAAARAEVVSGAKVVVLVGGIPARGFWEDWHGTYRRQWVAGEGKGATRAVYERQEPGQQADPKVAPKAAIWHVASSGEWHVGLASNVGERAGVLYAYDSALLPERVMAGWTINRGASKASSVVDATNVHIAVGKAGATELAATGALGRLEAALEPGWLFNPSQDKVLRCLRESVAAHADRAGIRAALQVARKNRIPAPTLAAAEAALAESEPEPASEPDSEAEEADTA